MTLSTVFFTLALCAPIIAFAFAIFVRSKVANTTVHILLISGGVLGLAGIATHASGFALIVPVLRIGLAIHGLSTFFLALIYIGTILTSIFAIEYVRRYENVYASHWLNAATALFIFGMQATVLSTSVLGFLLSWEIMSLAAYFLVIADRSNESMRAGFLYLVMTQIGFLAIAAGFLLVSNGDPWATWDDLTIAAHGLSPAVLSASFLLLFAGFGSKAGLVPLHQWLPYAHPQAPSHSSALLSGVMLKVALFGFLQSLSIFPSIPSWWALVVIGVGIVSALFGVIHAAIESDMKRLLAWSSIENMGLIFAAAGAVMGLSSIAAVPAAIALAGALTVFVSLHAFNHMLFKTCLFMSAGAIGALTHTRDLDQLGGLAKKWPLFSGAVMGLALGAAALPPFSTFVGEWLYVQSLATSIASLPLMYAAIAALMLAAVGFVAGLAVFTFVNFFANAFLGRARTEHAEHAGPMPVLLMVPPFVGAFSLLAIGPFVLPYIRGSLLDSQTISIFPEASLNPAFVVFAAGGIALLSYALARGLKASVRETETWDCGQPLTPRMQYTATGFSAPIRFFFRSMVLSRKRMIVEPIAPQNPWIARRRHEWSVLSFWEEWLYKPIGTSILRIASVAKRLQSGVVQVYLLLVMVALILTMIFAL